MFETGVFWVTWNLFLSFKLPWKKHFPECIGMLFSIKKRISSLFYDWKTLSASAFQKQNSYYRSITAENKK